MKNMSSYIPTQTEMRILVAAEEIFYQKGGRHDGTRLYHSLQEG